MRCSLLVLRCSLFGVLLFVVRPVVAQDDAALRAQGRAIVDSLCSPRYAGRGYVDNGAQRAAAWIAAEFKAAGLKPMGDDWFQPFTFDVNSFPEKLSVTIDGGTFIPGVDFLVDPASGKAQGQFDIVHLTPADLMLPERRSMTMGVVTGKAVMLNFPPSAGKDTLAMYAEWEHDLMHYAPVLKRANGKLTWSVSSEALPFPMIEISQETWPDTARVLEIDVTNRMLRQHLSRNVLGKVRAKKKSKEWVIISAHYDHLGMMGTDAIFPGANDNASGVAMLITLARHFSSHPGRYNMLFIAFAGEEAGLQGSEWCAVQRPVDLASVRLMINLDILGTGDDGIMVVNATAQEAVYDQLVAINTSTPRLAAIKKRGPACNSDHCPFVKRGVPAIFIYTLGGIAAYHDVNDKPETLPLTEFPDIFHTLTELVDALK